MAAPNVNFAAGDWLQLAMWAREQLASARVRNDSASNSAEDTAVIRGEIKFIKKLLGLPEEAARDSKAESTHRPFGGWDPQGSETT